MESFVRGDRAPVYRLPWRQWAVALLLAPCGLALHGCTSADGVEDRDGSARPTARGATAEWYEVLSQDPGPEVTDTTMRRKIEESGQPWKVRDRATGIETVLVLPGELLMGSPESEPGRNADEGPLTCLDGFVPTPLKRFSQREPRPSHRRLVTHPEDGQKLRVAIAHNSSE